ncbi:MAG: Rid family detoxifying hydrolase [Candidatus Saccharimonadales bacterium]
MIEKVASQHAPSADAILSQAIIANDTIYVSGQIHNSTDGKLVEGTVEEKLQQIMTNISNILEDAGSSFYKIVKVTIYVTDMSQMADLNKYYPGFFADNPLPAREAVCVKELPLGATIEISVVAVR